MAFRVTPKQQPFQQLGREMLASLKLGRVATHSRSRLDAVHLL